MSHYAGLDVSLEETAICVVDAMGRIVKEMRAPSEPEALVTALRETGLAFERIGLEACSLTDWLHDALTGASQTLWWRTEVRDAARDCTSSGL